MNLSNDMDFYKLDGLSWAALTLKTILFFPYIFILEFWDFFRVGHLQENSLRSLGLLAVYISNFPT